MFVLSCPSKLERCPLVIDPSGFWFRPDGEVFIAGDEPSLDDDDLPLEPQLAEFDETLWGRMAHRVPAFEALRVERAWAGYYDMNLFDGNAIIGVHPSRPGLWFINGFSGHGLRPVAAFLSADPGTKASGRGEHHRLEAWNPAAQDDLMPADRQRRDQSRVESLLSSKARDSDFSSCAVPRQVDLSGS